MTTEDALKWAFESDWGTDWTKDCQAMVQLAEEVQRLTNEARRFYQANGSFTTLDNPQQVMQLRIIAAGENKRLRAEVERLTAENEAMVQKTCDVCDGDGWVYNRVEGRGACVCMIEAEPFQILQTALETIGKAATGDIQIADDDTGGMRWIAGKAEEALHSVLPLDY